MGLGVGYAGSFLGLLLGTSYRIKHGLGLKSGVVSGLRGGGEGSGCGESGSGPIPKVITSYLKDDMNPKREKGSYTI